VMVQEKRGMLKVWNVSLIAGTFSLCLLGTFLVRSGVLQSIHAFGASTVGGPLLGLIAVVAIGSTVLIVSRLDQLRPERRIDSLLSRESIFLVNNLLLVGLALVIFWGTFFPLISEFFTGEKHSLAAPWFDRYVTPIGVLLVLFTGIGPLLAWGRLSASAARRLLLWPGLAAAATIAVLLVVGDAGSHPWALLVFLVGIAASSSFQTKEDVQLQVGQSASVGDYTIHYDNLTSDPKPERLAFVSHLTVTRDGKTLGALAPARNYYPTQDPSAGPIGRYFMGESTSEVGLRARAGGDLWTAFQPDLSVLNPDIKRGNRQLAGLPGPAQEFAILALVQHYVQSPPPATFRVIVNPLVGWIWIGALIALAGAVMAGWPALESRRRLEAAYRARLGRELGTATEPS
jgi:cytochrome c-type biogenesis protein CcmF